MPQVRPIYHFLAVRDARQLPRRNPLEELMARYAIRDDSNWPVARAYLTQTRRIDPAVVDEMHAVGSVYANDHRPNPSLVFLHRDAHGKVPRSYPSRHETPVRVPPLPRKQTLRVVHGREFHEC